MCRSSRLLSDFRAPVFIKSTWSFRLALAKARFPLWQAWVVCRPKWACCFHCRQPPRLSREAPALGPAAHTWVEEQAPDSVAAEPAAMVAAALPVVDMVVAVEADSVADREAGPAAVREEDLRRSETSPICLSCASRRRARTPEADGTSRREI